MLRVVLLAGLVTLGLSFNVELDNEWELYKTTFRKKYAQEEGLVRRFIWEQNLKRVQQHNLEADRGLHTYWKGMNEYADMTTEEFVNTMNGYRFNATKTNCGKFTSNLELADIPASVDWRTKGYVTPIKNQVSRGADVWKVGGHNSGGRSEQGLKAQDNLGCQCGWMDQAFEYIIKNKGIDTEASYPYKARTLKFKQADVGANETSCNDIEGGSEADLQKAVTTVGPISVVIDASLYSFQMYKSGIYSEPQCNPHTLDHGVLAVGYGTEGGNYYWLVKNSWGTSWGMQGYIMMARNKHNMCGIATKSSFPPV